jgi:hypothetical protein
MNRPRDKSIASEVKRRISSDRTKELWTYRDFNDLAPASVAASLSRMSRRGELRRVRKGVYHLPRKTAFGETRPDPALIANSALWRGDAVSSGLYTQIGITTQVPKSITVATNARTRLKDVRGIPVWTVTRPLSEQKGITPEERTVLDALRNLRSIPDTTPEAAINRIKTLIRTKRVHFDRLSRYAAAEPARVRALVGAIGEDLRCDPKLLKELRDSINPLSVYKIPGVKSLKSARGWRIK